MKITLLKKCVSVVVLLVVCATAAYAQRRGTRMATPAAELTSMKILPYHRSQDTLGDDILTTGEAGGFNELDLSFLVKVEIAGPKGEYSNRMLTVTAREGNKLILNKTLMVGIYNDNGKNYVAAWIYGPLCSTTVVQATLSGRSRRATIKKTLNFQCGE